ncbi:MAG TPA: hypothetical protein VLF87_02960 [Patescibacteria group bacterium]|nr:hypothetical protein [Patescibacteria group bacterium]
MREKMKRLIKSALVALTLGVTVGSLSLGFAVAQQKQDVANGFQISPVRSDLTIDKGKSLDLTISIQNPTSVATVAVPVVNDFVASDKEDGEPRLILDEKTPPPKNDFKKLVGSIDQVQLGPKEKKDITVKISVPDDANAGGYYGAIRFAPGVAGQTSTVGLTASVGTIVLVRVPGNLTEKLDLIQLSAEQNNKAKSFFTSGDVSILTRLKNSGDIHVQPFGKVQVKNTFGRVVYQYEFNKETNSILPDSTRRFDDALNAKHLVGRYTIESNLGYGQGGALITAKTAFWYIPSVVLYGLLLLIVIVVALVYWVIRKANRRRQHKHDVNKQKA